MDTLYVNASNYYICSEWDLTCQYTVKEFKYSFYQKWLDYSQFCFKNAIGEK